jgi:hypothetical protein
MMSANVSAAGHAARPVMPLMHARHRTSKLLGPSRRKTPARYAIAQYRQRHAKKEVVTIDYHPG